MPVFDNLCFPYSAEIPLTPPHAVIEPAHLYTKLWNNNSAAAKATLRHRHACMNNYCAAVCTPGPRCQAATYTKYANNSLCELQDVCFV